MNITPPPQDPPAIEGLATALKSTPLSQGTGTHSSYHTETQRPHYYAYLREDLRHSAIIDFDKFLELVWNVRLNENLKFHKLIAGNTKFKVLLEAFCRQVSLETERYNPFVELANHVLVSANEVDLRFARNDPTFIWGSYAERKPDVLVIFWEALKLGERGSDVDGFSKNGPGKDNAFHWGEVVDFWEFKLKVKEYGGPQDTPAQKKSEVQSRSVRGSHASSPSHKPAEPVRRSVRGQTVMKTAESDTLALSAPDSRKRGSSGGSDQAQKKAKLEEPEDTYLQAASYALEMFSHGNLRSHALGAVITDFAIELLYYDHSFTVRSTPFHFVDNPVKFVALLMAYAQLDDRQRGLETNITPKFISPGIKGPQDARHPIVTFFDGQIVKLPNGKRLILRDTIFRQHALIGRGTCVLRAEPSRWQEWSGLSVVIVKLGWPSVSRTSEHEIINHAIQAASVSWHEWVKNHLPEVLYSHTYPPDKDGPHARLVEFLKDSKYEMRELRLIVQTELFPITKLTNAAQVKKVFLDILKCHNWLYEVAGILHRDISLGNLMFRMVKGEPCGVLNDFDLASYVHRQTAPPTSNQRTGTKPFMAIDLLKGSPPPPHLYRHDLESFFYVFVFFVSRYLNGVEIPNSPLGSWLVKGNLDLAENKTSLVVSGIINPTNDFINLKVLLLGMKRALRDGTIARDEHVYQIELAKAQGLHTLPRFDEETLGGHVTFSAFHALFLHC